MKSFILAGLLISFLISVSLCQELIVTKAYTDYLKKHVTWEVVNYEDNIFRGWTVEEYERILGDHTTITEATIPLGSFDPSTLPATIDWSKDEKCFHEIRDQGKCGSCWTFSVAGTVADRCCLQGIDHGWLAPQELVSCDKNCEGCNGGDRNVAMQYVALNGLVPEACYPYLAVDKPCPSKCVNGNEWANSHVCKCTNIVNCNGVDKLRKCLTTGTVATGMIIYRDFHYYKSGIYHWDKKSPLSGYHAIRTVGYGDQPEPHWKCANSFGKDWGMNGFFLIGVGEVGIDSRNPVICDPIP